MTNLQRNIHPLALNNLRNLLDYNHGDWSKLMSNLKSQEPSNSDLKESENVENKQKMENIPEPQKRSSKVDLKDNDSVNDADKVVT